MKEEFIVTNDENINKRLDVFCSEITPNKFSRSYIQTSIKNGKILVNDRIKKQNYKLRNKDVVSIEYDKINSLENKILPEDIKLDIIYEDDYMLAINKNPDMIVHPAGKTSKGTIVNSLMYNYDFTDDFEDETRPGIVHRLDKDTTGVLLIAKSPDVKKVLSQQFKDRVTDKYYLAITKGKIKNKKGLINKPLGRNPNQRHKMTIMGGGKESITKYKVLKTFKHNYNLVWLKILTGRTHQIRVHLKYLKSPIIGDAVYNSKTVGEKGANRQMLHAAKISFFHPITNKRITLTAPLKRDFISVINTLNK
ncbi:MAG: RluA family pseudouridine synthase [Thermotogota bacterium]